jgi:hypothetical protein
MATASAVFPLLGLVILVLAPDSETRQTYAMPAGHTTVDMVGIDARDPAEIVQSRWMALILRLGRNLFAYDLVVGADSFAGSGDEVVDALTTYKPTRGAGARSATDASSRSCVRRSDGTLRLRSLAGRT